VKLKDTSRPPEGILSGGFSIAYRIKKVRKKFIFYEKTLDRILGL
jgi:hypothetical protein